MKTVQKERQSLERVTEQVRLEDGFNRGRRIVVTDCLWHCPNRRASVRNDLSPNAFVFTRGMTKVRMSDADRNCPVGVYG